MKTNIEMAHEAGLSDAEGWINEEYDYKEQILAFAELVRADEREACAKVCENEWGTLAEKEAGLMYAASIQARGNT